MRFLVFLLPALLVVLASACGDDTAMTDGGMDGATDTSTGTCEPPEELCGARCINTDNDGRNCGSCAFECAAGSFCSAGTCSRTCPAGTVACGGSCADLATDSNHCGECGTACADDEACRGGACTCPEGFTLCDDVCVNPDSDPTNCGICDRACDMEQICNMGTCTCAAGARESECSDMLDDDCDGMIDCDDPDCTDATRACMGSCGMGVETCDGMGAWGMCMGGSGEAEICGDGIDQDCNGSDERNEDMYEPNGDCDACTLLTTEIDPMITINARIDSVDDDVDCYKFIAHDGFSVLGSETITVDLTGIPEGEDYDIRLYRDYDQCVAGTALAFSILTGSADEQIVWTESSGADDGGTYYIFVTGFIGSHSCTEDYTLSVDGLN